MAKRDYYQILGATRSTPAEEIKKKYRALVRKLHPDVNREDPRAAQKFQEVQEAYDVLSDQDKRQRYDQYGHAGVEANFDPRNYTTSSGAGGGGYGWRQTRGVSPEDFTGGGVRPEDFGGGQYAEVFEELFGQSGPFGRAGGRKRPEPARGSDIEYPVTLDFREAARGTTLPIRMQRGGHSESAEIKIPAGVKTGSRVRLKGRGEQANGQPGDLFIVVNVEPHPYYRRDGLNVEVDVPVSMYEAVLGAKVKVPTLDGPVTITVPPGTGSGTKLRIRERGAFRGSEKGDQFCIIKVVVPRELDEEGRQLLQRLQEHAPLDARRNTDWAS
ncbi:MAG: DnaJ C-terminal domain-containing protein [Phycisphaerae bacterium]